MREYKPKKKNIIATTVINTPLGDMFCAATQKGICMLEFYDKTYDVLPEVNVEQVVETCRKRKKQA